MSHYSKKLSLLLCVLLLVSACTPVEQYFSTLRHASDMHDDFIVAGDDMKLPLKSWWPENKDKTEAIIIALHGFNDYSNAFSTVGPYFSVRNIALLAYDQRGFGKTQHHGIWAGKKNLVQDVKETVSAVKNKHPDIPIYILGESMGGAVAISAMADDNPPLVNGIILSAPAIWGDETMNGFYRTTLWLAAHTMPDSQFTGEGAGVLASDNIPALIALGKDPLVIKKTRVDAVYGIVKLMDNAYRKIGDVKSPMLLLYGAKDQVIPKEPVRKALHKITAEHKVAYYPEGYHMLLRDLKADIVLNDIISWIKYQKKALPSGYDRNAKKRNEYIQIPESEDKHAKQIRN